MRIVDSVSSLDSLTVKFLQKLHDGFVIETVHINTESKHVICFSTQVGCVIGCTFCASGLRKEGRFNRSLSDEEMFEQCSNVARGIDFSGHPKPLLFSCMGEGEPFLNFENCVRVFRKLAQTEWPVPVRIAVSTSGIRPDLICRLAEMQFDVPLKLQVSLHGPSDEVRRKLVPVTKPLLDILNAARVFKDSGKSIDLNYVLCEGVNDRLEHAQLLAEVLGSGWHVKFTELNPNTGSLLKPSGRYEIFSGILRANGISTESFRTNEGDVSGGCGQLSYHHTKT